MKIDTGVYNKMVEAFREKPAAYTHAAAAAGVTRPTATRAWKTGWPKRHMLPIRDVIENEKIAARAALAADAEQRARDEAERAHADAERSRDQAIAVRKAEGKMVEAMRGNLIALTSILGRSVRGLVADVPKIEKMIRDGVDEHGKPLTLDKRIELIGKFSRAARSLGMAGGEVLRMERLLLGEPTDIIGVQGMDGEVTPEKAQEELDRASALLERTRRRQRDLRLVVDNESKQAAG